MTRFPVLLFSVMLVVVGCTSEGADAGAAPTTAGGGADLSGDITVFAASSLTDAFTQMGEDFEAANSDTSVAFNFGSSADLADSITGGDALGTADIFASADGANIDKIVDAGDNASEPLIFAQNRAEIAVPPGNPGNVDGLEDFADEDLFIGLCAPDAPCGAYAAEVFDNAGITPSVDTEEAKVTDVVAKVESGDLDAGIVYVSDVVSAGDDLVGIEIPEEINVLADYPLVTVNEGPNPDVATAFIAYVQSPAGRQTLRDAGFLIPG